VQEIPEAHSKRSTAVSVLLNGLRKMAAEELYEQ
jgi:hypothetical protein